MVLAIPKSPFVPAVIPFFWAPGKSISANTEISFPSGMPAVHSILHCVRWRLTEGAPNTLSVAEFTVVETTPSGNEVYKELPKKASGFSHVDELGLATTLNISIFVDAYVWTTKGRSIRSTS